MALTLTRSHEEATIERFQRDPQLAAEYFAVISREGNNEELLQAKQLLEKLSSQLKHG
jgi:hypothetical protein